MAPIVAVPSVTFATGSMPGRSTWSSSALSNSFQDPFGTGHLTALLLAIFAEVVCSIFVLIGLWTRAALIPLICAFLTIAFVVLAGKGLGAREMPLLYLFGFATLFFTGAGSFSLSGLTRAAAKKAGFSPLVKRKRSAAGSQSCGASLFV